MVLRGLLFRAIPIFVFSFAVPGLVMAQVCLCWQCGLGTHKSYVIQAASMSPALDPGDCAIARRVAGEPEDLTHGDIVVFKHPAHNTEFVKRLIAMPGDTVQMRDGSIWLNNSEIVQIPLPDHIEPYVRRGAASVLAHCRKPVPLGGDCIKQQALETLFNGVKYPVLNIGDHRLDHTDVQTVPEGHVFVLGDNRDNSMDSRISQNVGGIGFVPIENITGVVKVVRK